MHWLQRRLLRHVVPGTDDSQLRLCHFLLLCRCNHTGRLSGQSGTQHLFIDFLLLLKQIKRDATMQGDCPHFWMICRIFSCPLVLFFKTKRNNKYRGCNNTGRYTYTVSGTHYLHVAINVSYKNIYLSAPGFGDEWALYNPHHRDGLPTT